MTRRLAGLFSLVRPNRRAHWSYARELYGMQRFKTGSWLFPALVLGAWLAADDAAAQLLEPAECRSPNPGDWPEPAKPYFMLIVDNSGSMDYEVSGAAPSCTNATYPTTRTGHARCAVYNAVQAFSGLVEFGLAQFVSSPDCGATNGSVVLPAWDPATWTPDDPSPDPYVSPYLGDSVLLQRRSLNILVPISQSTTAADLLTWVDNRSSNGEISANTWTPLGGALRDAYRYFSNEWVSPATGGGPTYATPLSPADPTCRRVNVILLTDGDESCDPDYHVEQEPGAAVEAAAALNQGFNLAEDDSSRPPRRVLTHVIQFAGGTQSRTDAIARAGGTSSSIFATNEAELSSALADIIAGAIAPERCNNLDDNCNGCTDEGYRV